jgi:hypothetical protein
LGQTRLHRTFWCWPGQVAALENSPGSLAINHRPSSQRLVAHAKGRQRNRRQPRQHANSWEGVTGRSGAPPDSPVLIRKGRRPIKQFDNRCSRGCPVCTGQSYALVDRKNLDLPKEGATTSLAFGAIKKALGHH